MAIFRGKKTYIVAMFLGLQALLTALGILPGDSSEAIRAALEAAGLATLRAGVAKR